MKIRNGFVSNSSSSSFVLIGNTPSQDSKQYGKTFTRTSRKNSTVHNDYEILHIEDYEGETSYCRSNIMWVSSITGKIRYIMALYARYYENDPNYFQKVLDARSKIFELGIEHWYSIDIPIPPLFARYVCDWDFENHKMIPETKHIETYVNIYTECSYSKDIVKMIEDEDTSLLDRFIFSSNSFCVLGGDEYDETYKLQRKAVEALNVLRNNNPDFSYKLIADWEDHDIGDKWYDDEGKEHTYEYESHWEKDCFEHEEWDDEDGYDEVEIIYD